MKFNRTLAATIVAAAISSAPVWAATSHPVTGEKLADEQVYTYAVLDEHSSLDPQIVEDVSGSDHIRNLFEGLLNQDADGNLIPGVAERFEASDDKMTYTFYLRKDAKWTNGDTVTANDFVYAWKRAVNPETASPYSWYMEIMSIKNGGAIIAGEADVDSLGVKALDDFTFQVELEAALPYFAQMVTHSTTFPTHQATVEKHGDNWTKPENMVSNGAYKLTTHVVNERVEMVKNDMYWDAGNTILDKVVSIVIPDDNQALIRWKAGELDKGVVPSGQFKSLRAEYGDMAVSVPSLCSYYYSFNVSESGPEALKDKRVRQALSYAIDRNVITENILQAGQEPAYTFTPGATAGFEVPKVPFGEMTQAQRDAKAKELLADAGYGPSNPLNVNILYNTSEGHKSIAIAITQMWKSKLGVQATMNNMEWKTFLEERGNQNFEIARGGWCGDYNEASTFLDLVTTPSGYNDGKFSNKAVDTLMKGARTMANPSANYTRVEEIMAEEMPLIPIYHYTSTFMLDSDIKGWPYNNVQTNWYAKDMYKVAK